MGTLLRVMWSEVPSVRAPQGYFLRAPALGNSRCVPALGNSRRSLHFVPLCTRTEHLLLAVVTLLTGAVLLNVELLLHYASLRRRSVPRGFRSERGLQSFLTSAE